MLLLLSDGSFLRFAAAFCFALDTQGIFCLLNAHTLTYTLTDWHVHFGSSYINFVEFSFLFFIFTKIILQFTTKNSSILLIVLGNWLDKL